MNQVVDIMMLLEGVIGNWALIIVSATRQIR